MPHSPTECCVLVCFGRLVVSFHAPHLVSTWAGGGTGQLCYVEEFRGQEMQSWDRWAHIHVSALGWKGPKRTEENIPPANDDMQILKNTPAPQSGIRAVQEWVLFFLTWNTCTFPWDFLPIIALIWNVCFVFVLDPLGFHEPLTQLLRTEHWYLFGRNVLTVHVQLLSKLDRK